VWEEMQQHLFLDLEDGPSSPTTPTTPPVGVGAATNNVCSTLLTKQTDFQKKNGENYKNLLKGQLEIKQTLTTRNRPEPLPRFAKTKHKTLAQIHPKQHVFLSDDDDDDDEEEKEEEKEEEEEEEEEEEGEEEEEEEGRIGGFSPPKKM